MKEKSPKIVFDSFVRVAYNIMRKKTKRNNSNTATPPRNSRF